MSARVELDESKLSAWLGELSLENSPPAQLRTAKLGPLWSFLGLAKTELGLPRQEQNQKSTSPEISIFPSTAASEDLQQTKARVDNLTKTLAQLQRESDDLHAEVSVQTAYTARLQRLNLLLQWQREELKSHTVKLHELLQNAKGGGVWADTAKEQSAIVRASLENQVATKMDAKTVDSSSLDWSAAEESTDLHGSPCIDEDAPRLSSESSVLNACMGQAQQDLQLVKAYVTDVDRSEDAKGIIDHTASFRDHGVPDYEELVHSSRREHVKLFFDTQKAAEAQTEAATKIKDLHTTLERLCGGSAAGEQRKALLMIIADVAGNQAAIQSLTQQLETHKRFEGQLEDTAQSLEELQSSVVDSRMRNLMADEVIQELISDSSAFLAGWDDNSHQVQALLQASLQEKSSLLAEQQALTGLIARETALLHNAPFPWWNRQGLDGLNCLSVAAGKQELKQAVRKASTMQKAEQLLAESSALASINPAQRVSYQLSDYTAELQYEKQLLADAKASVDVAAQRAGTTVPQVLQAWWEQPAINCAPWVQVDGKNAKAVLHQFRTLHAAVPQASTAATGPRAV